MRVRFLALALVLALLTSACTLVMPEREAGDGKAMDDDAMGMDMSGGSMPADLLDAQPTDNGQFRVSAVSRIDPVVINETHAWTLRVETAGGDAVENARIEIAGGMPEHDHGFPTAPRVTQDLGEGEYLLEGMRFNMGGVWVLTLEISAGGESDSLTFEIELN